MPNELYLTLSTPHWREFGRSTKNRQLWIRSWQGRSEDSVLLFGAIHGDEPLGVSCLLALAAELDARFVVNGDLPRSVCIVPVVNPDGFLVGKKDNAAGVDLNRNFAAQNWQRVHKPGYDPGLSPASEPETRALMQLIEDAKATRFIALHSPFRTVNYDGPSRGLAERMAAKNGYGARADIGYPTPGSFGTLYGCERGLEVITLEIPPMTPAQAWAENRTALYEAIELLPSL